jgi:hypothetical protein
VWLKGQAGAVDDSLEVVVHGTTFRWAFGPSAGPYVAGSNVLYEFAVVDEEGDPVPGVPVVFAWSPREPPSSGVDSVLTGADGFARVTIPLPARPTIVEIPSYIGVPSIFLPAFRAEVSATLPDGRAVGDSSRLEVSPGAPDHIEVLALRREYDLHSTFPPYGYLSMSLRYRVLSGDDVVLRSLSTLTTEGSWKRDHRFADTLAVSVADRFGNPTGIHATIATDGPALETRTEGLQQESSSFLCSFSCRFPQYARVVHRTGSVVVTRLAAPLAPTRLTISSPGLPSRTVTVVGVDSIP